MRYQKVDDQNQEQRRRPSGDLDVFAELEVRVRPVGLHGFVAEQEKDPDAAADCCAI